MLMGQVAKNNREIDEFKRQVQKKLDLDVSQVADSSAPPTGGVLVDDLAEFNEVYGKDAAKLQSLRFARIKDAYQDTMFKVLQEKGAIVK
mmetsp:Transcript_26732/g.20028  ORF Transcript_26732/g.20028 Transcript_26732/m.20028 type:complete len:90 (-) Transcript_26732:284-553(-)